MENCTPLVDGNSTQFNAASLNVPLGELDAAITAHDAAVAKAIIDQTVQPLTDVANLTINWALGSTATLTLDRAATTITMSGGYDGQNCTLIVKQYAGPGAITLDSSVRPGTDTSLTPTLTATNGKEDYLGFKYRGGSIAKYDFIAFAQGF